MSQHRELLGRETRASLALVFAGVALAGAGRWTLPRWARALAGGRVPHHGERAVVAS